MSSTQFSGQHGQGPFQESFKFLEQLPGGAKLSPSKNSLGCFNEHTLIKPFKFSASPYQYKIVALRECPTPDQLQCCDTPERAAAYWKLHVPTHPFFNPEVECFSVLLLNTRRRVKGHEIVSVGTLDTILVHPREVFRLAIATSAAAIILVHNHPSGDPTPSEADIKVTRDLLRAGQLLRIEVLDHVIVGQPSHASLRELGYFY